MLSSSLLSADFTKLGYQIEQACEGGANLFHFDVMDGSFVPNISIGIPVLKSIRKAFPDIFLDVHLMIDRPELYVETFAEAGADAITFHIEATNHPQRVLTQIRALDKKAGIALNPHTSPNVLDFLWADTDLILLMSVNPGFGGQKFLDSTYEKIKIVRDKRRDMGGTARIMVDGGVTLKNAPKLKALGVDIAVAGNSVFGTADPADAVRAFLRED